MFPSHKLLGSEPIFTSALLETKNQPDTPKGVEARCVTNMENPK